MVRDVSAVRFRQNLGDMLNQVQYQHDAIVVRKDGAPVAALVDAGLFLRIQKLRDRFESLSNRIAATYAMVPVEDGLVEIATAVRDERKQ